MNILLAIICILLIGVLGAIFVMSHESEKKEAQRLEELAGSEQKGIEDYEAVKEHAAELEKEDAAEDDSTETKDNSKAEKDAADSSKNKEDSAKSDKSADSEKKETTDSEETAATEDDTAKEHSGIVCWGDDLINGTDSDTYSYMAVLQKLLTEKGYSDLTVINKTLQGGGTLSMMKMAGVSDDIIQGYITKHQQAANGAQESVI